MSVRWRSRRQGRVDGARGNSGVILSQLWRGFRAGCMSQDVMDQPCEVSGARDTAYKGVVRPVEGTILTVAKDVAAAAEKPWSDKRPYDILGVWSQPQMLGAAHA